MDIARHVSKKMLQHYSHERVEAKRKAPDALSMKPGKAADSRTAGEGYDTNNDTTLRKEIEGMPQVIESLVVRAVSSKPLSRRISLLSGNITGKSAEFQSISTL